MNNKKIFLLVVASIGITLNCPKSVNALTIKDARVVGELIGVQMCKGLQVDRISSLTLAYMQAEEQVKSYRETFREDIELIDLIGDKYGSNHPIVYTYNNTVAMTIIRNCPKEYQSLSGIDF